VARLVASSRHREDDKKCRHYGTDGDYRRRCAKVAPMQILTDGLVRHEYDGDSSTTVYKRKQPEDAAVKRLIEPEDVADVVLWLCGPHSGHVTGTSIAMDGGWTAS